MYYFFFLKENTFRLLRKSLQADGIKMALESKGLTANVYVGMRYWYPFTEEAILQVRLQLLFSFYVSFEVRCESPHNIYLINPTCFIWQIKKDKITKLVVLPLYPQFSISTTGSSLRVLQNIFRCYIHANFLFFAEHCLTLTSLDVSELSVKMRIYQGFQLPLYSPGINEKGISSLWLT